MSEIRQAKILPPHSVFLKDGYLTFGEDQLEIFDKVKRNRNLMFILILFPAFYGITSILSYDGTGDVFNYYSGIAILTLVAIGLLLAVFGLSFRKKINHSKIITFQEIKNVHLKRGAFENLLVDIVLNDKTKRSIFIKDEKPNTDAFLNMLKQNNITIEVDSYTF